MGFFPLKLTVPRQSIVMDREGTQGSNDYCEFSGMAFPELVPLQTQLYPKIWRITR